MVRGLPDAALSKLNVHANRCDVRRKFRFPFVFEHCDITVTIIIN
jgi:hypothetical protein